MSLIWGWRPYAPLVLGIMTAIGHRELKSDFSVSDFNDYDHAICILIEGIGKCFIALEASGGAPLGRRRMLSCARAI